MVARCWITAVGVWVGVAMGAAALRGQAIELVFADGRRGSASAPRQDSKGQWTIEREGRRTPLRAGEIVAFVDAEGRETLTIPVLQEGKMGAAVAAALKALEDPRSSEWMASLDALGNPPARETHDALLRLLSGSREEVRLRAYQALARLRTRESALALASAVLKEKDPKTRKAAVSVLFSVQEILRRAESSELLDEGLRDKAVGVRIAFALLAKPGNVAALKVLRPEGLKGADHHLLESCTMELGRQADPAGEKILIGMLTRTSLPDADPRDPIYLRLLIEEQSEVCRLLGKWKSEPGKAALGRAAKSPHAEVRAAAEAALANSSGSPGPIHRSSPGLSLGNFD